MNGVAHCLVRVPDITPVTLATFLAEHTTSDDETRALAVQILAAGVKVSTALVDGRSVILERQGFFIVGTVLPEDCHEREACLAAIGHVMAGHFIPGGSVDVWLAPVSTFALLGLMTKPCGRWREHLLTEVGRARGATARTLLEAYPLDATGLRPSHYAASARLAWATCALAREALAMGRPDVAKDALRPLGRALAEIPTALATRFVPRLDALYAQAEAMQARQLSDEVA